MDTMWRPAIHRNALPLLLFVASIGTPPGRLVADVVGEGTPDSCTEAALDAALAEGGTITFACGPNPVTITLTAFKVVARDTSVDGGGLITWRGSDFEDRVVFVSAGVRVTIANLSLSNTVVIRNSEGKLTISQCSFSGGGSSGLQNDGGRLTVDDSTFRNYNFSAITNRDGTLAVTGSTFVGNSSTLGGAIYNWGSLVVVNSTFAGNEATVRGGALYNRAGTARVINATFADNSAPDGGAISRFAGRVIVQNSIVAHGPTGENCGGGSGISDRGNNIDSGDSCGFDTTRGSLTGTDPQLDPVGLADNGGPTQTIALQDTSPAIDAGKKGVCNSARVGKVDQRGFARPGTDSTTCTIGAFEFDSPGPRRR